MIAGSILVSVVSLIATVPGPGTLPKKAAPTLLGFKIDQAINPKPTPPAFFRKSRREGSVISRLVWISGSGTMAGATAGAAVTTPALCTDSGLVESVSFGKSSQATEGRGWALGLSAGFP